MQRPRAIALRRNDDPGRHGHKNSLDPGVGSKAYVGGVSRLNGMTVGSLARMGGVCRATVRFYEREGLLPRPRRSPSGYRLYSAGDADRLSFVRHAQATGLTLDDIRELLRSQQLRSPEACRRVAQRLRERIEVLDRKIAELKAFRGELAEALAQCEEGDESCPVVLSFARDASKEEEIG